MKPRVFLSAVSHELAKSRQLAANILVRLGYEPVWQDIFGTESGEICKLLQEKNRFVCRLSSYCRMGLWCRASILLD